MLMRNKQMVLGRGAIQLSWNYNYKDFGAAVGLDLVAQPELVATDKNLVWRSALWYWNTDKWNGNIHNVVGQPGGFAYTTYLINGGLECGLNPPNKDSEKARIANYIKFCSVLGCLAGRQPLLPDQRVPAQDTVANAGANAQADAGPLRLCQPQPRRRHHRLQLLHRHRL